jgi:photosystem II stability/assembly factor-like uncharacterized protein
MTIVGTVWTPRGPSPITDAQLQFNGMTTAIAVNPNDGDTIYIGTAGGGVWKTRDGGGTWTSLFDRQFALGIGEPMGVAIDPNNTDTIYVGTSSRGRVSPQQQDGIHKSTDGGASWILLGSGYPVGNTGNASRFVADLVNAIIVDPANSQTLYLGSSSGVWRSTDGGQNWTLGTGSGGDARSLVLDTSSPTNARILYAGISGSGVIQSTDGGQTWTQILSSATPAVATALAAVAGTTMNQVVVDLAPPTSPPAAGGVQVLYVAIAASGPQGTNFPDPLGLFISTDQGANWTQQTATGMPSTTFSGYCLAIAVDPASPGDGANDTIYFGAINQTRSTDSGASFTAMAGLHADTHAWAFFRPSAPGATVVYAGHDGGISRSTDGGNTWTQLNAGGLQTALFYNFDVKPDATASVSIGALQDNRIEISTSPPGWTTVVGGDGWDGVYDGTTANQLFATTNAGPAPQTRVKRSTDDGATWTDVTPWGNTGTEAGFFLATLAADPSAAGVVYATSNQNLWQTQDGGNTWQTIGAFASGFITAKVSVAPTNGNNVVVANGGQVSVSTDALAATVTFTNITRNLPGRSVLRAAFDPSDSTVIYAVLAGVAAATGGAPGHVFRTTIGGTAWTDISPPGIDVPFGALALDGSDTPTTIYVGTDFGVLRSVDLGATWYVLDDLHFPHAPVTDLVIGRGSNILRAATYGRGVFEFVRPDWPTIAVDPEAGLGFGTVCDGPAYLTLRVFNVGSGDLIINSVQRLMGSTGFQVLASPGTPLVVAAGEDISFTVQFVPTTPGIPEAATIRIVSNDPGAPVVDLLATGTGGTASLEVMVADNGDFGEVCLGDFVDKDLVINNRGPCPLQIFGVASTLPEFMVPVVISYPLVVAAGGSIEVPIRFQPSALGPASATITIFSNDPASPATVDVTGTAPPPRLSLSIANSGNFGDTCVGSFHDEPLTLANSGACPLTITGITSSSPEFIVPDVDAFPLLIAPGSAIELTLRFQPTSFGPKSATITVTSDDPGGPRSLQVSGNAPSGTLAVSGTTDFGGVELGQHAQQTLTICNVGKCDLQVTRVAFKPPCPCDKVRHRGCGCGCGCKGGHGHGRPGGYGDEDHDHNEGDDDGGHDHGKGHGHKGHSDQCCLNFTIVSNPFPATLHPGACLGVLIQYIPTCDSAACCELIIETDDPENPTRTLFVTGHLRRTLRSALKCWAAQELHDILQAGNC